VKKKYHVLGFNEDSKYVIFEVEKKEFLIKSNLPKSELIAYLDIPAPYINKDLRDQILEEARIKGRLKYCYSYDGEKWFRHRFMQFNGRHFEYKYCKRIHVDKLEDLPMQMNEKEIQCYLAKNS